MKRIFKLVALISATLACATVAVLTDEVGARGKILASRISGLYKSLEYSEIRARSTHTPAQATAESRVSKCPPFLRMTLTHTHGQLFRLSLPDGLSDPTGACSASNSLKPTNQYLMNHGEARGSLSDELVREKRGVRVRIDGKLPSGLLQCGDENTPRLERISINSLNEPLISLLKSALAPLGVPYVVLVEALQKHSSTTSWSGRGRKEAHRRIQAALERLDSAYALTISSEVRKAPVSAPGASVTLPSKRESFSAPLSSECLYFGGDLTFDEIMRIVDDLVDAISFLAHSSALPLVNIPATKYYTVSSECSMGGRASLDNLSVEVTGYSNKGAGTFGADVELEVRVNDGKPCAKTYVSRLSESEDIMKQSRAGREALKTAEKAMTTLERRGFASEILKPLGKSLLALSLPRLFNHIQKLEAKRRLLVAHVSLEKCDGFENAAPVTLLFVERRTSQFLCRHHGKIVSCLTRMPLIDMNEKNTRTTRSLDASLEMAVGREQLIDISKMFVTRARRHEACVFSSTLKRRRIRHVIEVGSSATMKSSQEMTPEPSQAPPTSKKEARKPVSAAELLSAVLSALDQSASADPSQEPSADSVDMLNPVSVEDILPEQTPEPSTMPRNEQRGVVNEPPSDSEATPTKYEPEIEKKRACFPARALVLLRDGREVAMSKLRVGNEVQVAPGVFSPVLLLSHADASAITNMVRVDTKSSTIVVSSTHYLYANGSLKRAGDVVVDDAITVAHSGRFVQEHVISVSRSTEVGLYNPQTASGTLLARLDHCTPSLVSTYTTALHPTAAHALLAPLRMVHKASRISVPELSKLFCATNYGEQAYVSQASVYLLTGMGFRSASYF